MNNSVNMILGLLIVCLAVSCGRDIPVPSIPEKNSSFQKTVFTEPTYGKTITLISDKECEIKHGRDILLAGYTRQENNLRVVMQALGTTSVVYYEITAQGLRDANSGEVLLLPEAMIKMIKWREEMRLAKEAEEARQLKEAEDRRARNQEIARKLLESKTPTATLETFSFWVSTPNGPKTQEIKVTDVDVTFLNNFGNKSYKAWYGYVSGMRMCNNKFVSISFKTNVEECAYEESMFVPFDTEERRATIVQTVNKAVAAWRTRFPDQALSR